VADKGDLPHQITLHGWPFELDGALIARSFELWTHTDDIRRATGRPLGAPAPSDIRAMSSFSVEALPLTLALTSPGRPLTPTRVVLTGAGGGTFDLPPTPSLAPTPSRAPTPTGSGTPSTLVVVDVVDYCRVVARRIGVDTLNFTITGDESLARALLHSATVFAV
jgi:hypothetical protein